MKKNYNTSGRSALLSFFKAHPDRQFTAEELCRQVHGDESTGKSSVYRHLTALCREETVRRFQNEEKRCSVYQYVGRDCDCEHRFHQQCIVCGSITHLDSRETEHLSRHLLQQHGFEVLCGRSVLYGLCAQCRKQRKEPT